MPKRPSKAVAGSESVADVAEPKAPKTYERIEIQAPLGFTARLDAVRRRRGLSLSAYMRQAVLLAVEADEAKAAMPSMSADANGGAR
jgi:hypothetical protein